MQLMNPNNSKYNYIHFIKYSGIIQIIRNLTVKEPVVKIDILLLCIS